MRLNILKFIYRGILTGMPLITYNPITKNTLNLPMTVLPYSTYINFKLDKNQTSYLNNYIKGYSSDIEIVPINLDSNGENGNYLSLNIYNCSSPAFMNDDKETTRFEINTYVKDKNGNLGTLIIDYLSNDLSMDPVNIFKLKDDVIYKQDDLMRIIDCKSLKERIDLKINFTTLYDKNYNMSDKLIEYTDKIYYKNGIYDRIYYDSSLVNANTRSPELYFNTSFKYKDLFFDELHSIFYFTKNISFIGGMWANLYDINQL